MWVINSVMSSFLCYIEFRLQVRQIDHRSQNSALGMTSHWVDSIKVTNRKSKVAVSPVAVSTVSSYPHITALSKFK